MADEKTRDVSFVPRADRDIVMIPCGKQKLVDIRFRIVVERESDCA